MLLVEDDPATRKALKALLGRQGWEVSAVSTLADAWPILESGPEAVILDLMLPDGDGSTLLRAVRDRGLSTRVIVATGTGDTDRLAGVRLLLPDSLLTKPVTLDQIIKALGPPPGPASGGVPPASGN